MSFEGLSNDQVLALGGVIGGVAGTVGTAVVAHFLQTKHENAINRKNVVDKYLLQLQDAVEDLIERLEVPLPKEIPDLHAWPKPSCIIWSANITVAFEPQ